MMMLSRLMRLVGLLALSSLLVLACKREVSQHSAEADGSAQETPTDDSQVGANLRVSGDSARTRGMVSADEFDFAAQFPQLYSLVRGDESMRRVLSDYARRVVTQQALNSEADLVALFQVRDETVLPRLTPFFENRAEEIEPKSERYEQELNRLGMSITMAEGMITGLGPAPMLEATVAQVASPAFKAYQRFVNARTQSYDGEYPYMNMAPYEEMVLAGEELMAWKPNPYWKKVEEDFAHALHTVTDLHMVQNTSAREEAGTPMVGRLNREFYPYAAEIDRLKDFAQRHPNSGFAQAAQKIAQNPSQMTDKPENLYLIILEWARQEQEARQQVQQYLRQGEDIPHYLPIKRGDGSTQYAVTYRFFESPDQAEEALQRIRSTHPEAEMIFCSVKGDQLYQVGPAAR
jgi:hypothetical protein